MQGPKSRMLSMRTLAERALYPYVSQNFSPWYPSAGSVKPGNLPDALQSKWPPSITMPPMDVPWPPIHLVQECVTMSAPCLMGWHR